jgi:hypothetical protein
VIADSSAEAARPSTDWRAWHQPYADPDSALSRRLAVVRSEIGSFLDARPDEPITVLSACAGEGRDVLGVLAGRADAARVRVTLIESDPRNLAQAERFRQDAQLAGVRLRKLDAGLASSYLDAAPADLVLICGVFGNIGDFDVRQLIGALPQLCQASATIIWTRSRRHPDLTPQLRGWLAAAGFTELSFTAPSGVLFSVGVHRYDAEPQPLVATRRWFSFVR